MGDKKTPPSIQSPTRKEGAGIDSHLKNNNLT